ncbi:MAG: transcriptional regulator PpsR [Gemmatirosa sp.]
MAQPSRVTDDRGFDARARDALAVLDANATAALVTAVADVALIVDGKGIIRNVALGGAEAGLTAAEDWVGRRWVETVTSETKGKVEAVLRDATQKGISSRRQVNHLSDEGPDIPVAYTAVRVGSEGLIVAVGRDLRAMSVLQQRLVETQQAMERDYWKLRNVETRYRLLFQLSTEAVLVVDSGTRRVVDANSAAAELFGIPAEKLHGRVFPFGTSAGDAQALSDLLAAARASGRGGDVAVRLAGHDAAVRVSASCFRQDAATLFLVRFVPASTERPAHVDAPSAATMLALLEQLPDGFVVTDRDGMVLRANQAFLDIAELASEQHAVGRSIGEWIGRPGADLAMLLTVLKKHERVRLMATSVRGEHGTATEVEVSATTTPADDADGEPCLALVVRDVGRRVAAGPQGARDLTRAVENLTALVGRVSLPELLRDTVDLVERHFIEAALELTNDNRTAAAEVLGLSRQSVYVKLRRHRLLAAEDGEAVDEAG